MLTVFNLTSCPAVKSLFLLHLRLVHSVFKTPLQDFFFFQFEIGCGSAGITALVRSPRRIRAIAQQVLCMSTSYRQPSSPSPADQSSSEEGQTGAVPLMGALCGACVRLSSFEPKRALDFELHFCLCLIEQIPLPTNFWSTWEKSVFKKSVLISYQYGLMSTCSYYNGKATCNYFGCFAADLLILNILD